MNADKNNKSKMRADKKIKPKVYIDGSEGTTGLQIYERLSERTDIELLSIDPGLRKDAAARAERINAADLVFLCLPDAAAREAVSMIDPENRHTKIIDASTAHRVSADWVYGFPELCPQQRENIRKARFTANPGCHATGLIAVTAPLVQAGILPPDYPLSAFSLTGYSGGGKKMITEYKQAKREFALEAPRLYGLLQAHKHLPEIQLYAGLSEPPAFIPIVDDYYCGMSVTVTLFGKLLRDIESRNIESNMEQKPKQNISAVSGPAGVREVRACLSAHYAGQKLIKVSPEPTEGMLSANLMSGTDGMEIFVNGNDERISVTAVFDNLGKGASGAAVQNMNLMLGFPETEGLRLPQWYRAIS